MPADPIMTWLKKRRAWTKQYKGHHPTISCRQLSKWIGRHVPETKEGSYRVADLWWKAFQAKVDGQKAPHPHASYLSELAIRMAWARRQGYSGVASEIAAEIARIERGGTPWYLTGDDIPLEKLSEECESHLSCEYDREGPPPDHDLEQQWRDDEVSRAFDPADVIWNDRISHGAPDAVPDDLTMANLTKSWLSLRQEKVEAGDLSPKGYDNTVDCLNNFRDWLGQEIPVTLIDAKRWEAYWVHLSGKVKDKIWSREYATKVFRTARTYVEWLVRRDLIPLPKNLHDRELRFRKVAKKIETMTVDEVRTLIDLATGQLKLHLLMMANCGMTQRDIADLRQHEVDLVGGRITRRRSKTGHHEEVPTVQYKLWPLTRDLLREHGEETGDRALLTHSHAR